MLAGTWTTFAYNTNDTVQSVTDARNATATYTYNARRLVTGITYSAPANITPTAPVSFLYDAVGNRTQMTDGSGSHLYYYDQFSRMTSETQTITGLAGAQTLSYTYTLAGQLKSLTDPQGRTVNYGYDRVGRTSAVTGVGYSNTSQFMGNFQYRAWGAVSHFNQGVNLSSFINVNYNTRLKPSHFEVGPGGPLYPKSMDSDYTYNADGQIQFAADKVPSNYSNVPYGAFDRAYRYDHQGRLIEALSGTESRGGTTADGPYNETYNYNALGNMTARSARLWSGGWNGFNHTYTNGRNQSWQYDAAGHVTQNDGGNYTFDAAGRVKTSPTYFSGIVGWGTYPILWQGVAQQLDNGDGQTVKQVDTDPVYGYPSRTDYYVRSTVLKGNVIARVHQESGTSNTEISIYHAGERIARSGDSGYVEFEYRDPITGHYIWQAGEVEVNPFGQSVGTYDPGEDEPGDSGNFPVPHEYGNAEDVNLGCVIDGIASPCQEARRLLDLHVADAVPLDYSDDITDFTTQTEYEDEDYDDGAQPTIDENGVINVPSLRYRTLIKTSVTPIKRTIANRKLTAQEKKVFNSAFNEAYNRLSRPECAEAVSGGNAGVVDIVNYAKDVFDGFTDSVTYAGTGISEDGDTFASIPTADLGARHGAHLSLYDNFFEDNAVIVQKISSRGALPKAAKGINIPVITLVQARASTLLHELAHAFGIKHNNQKESNALNDKILLACFPEVATAIQVKYGTINPRN
jgi:YD repeat-containing protein